MTFALLHCSTGIFLHCNDLAWHWCRNLHRACCSGCFGLLSRGCCLYRSGFHWSGCRRCCLTLSYFLNRNFIADTINGHNIVFIITYPPTNGSYFFFEFERTINLSGDVSRDAASAAESLPQEPDHPFNNFFLICRRFFSNSLSNCLFILRLTVSEPVLQLTDVI